MFIVMIVLGALIAVGGRIVAWRICAETEDPGVERIAGALYWITTLAGLLMMSYALFNGVFFYAEPGYKYHVRTILGQERVVDGVGYKVHLFGRRNAWKKAMTVQAVSDESFRAEGNTDSAEDDATDSSASLPPQTILFLDQVNAETQATVRFRLPSDAEQFLKLVHEYRTPSNFLTTSLIPAFRETLQATGSLLSAEEYFSGGRTEFNTEFENQMQNGIYIVRRHEQIVRDPGNVAPGSANIAKGTSQDAYGDDRRVVFKVSKVPGKDGLPLRKSQKYTDYGVTVVDARITEMKPNAKFAERMTLKQQASADRAIAREQRVQEEERRLLEIAKGERKVSERQATAKVEQIEKTTKAETDRQLAVTKARLRKDEAEIDKQTAEIKLERAKLDAEARRVAADAAAYEKKAIIEADNALAQKLEAYVKSQQVWAAAYARRKVPRQVFGGTAGSTGSDMDLRAFMQLMTARAAQELAFDPGLERKAGTGN